MRFGEIASGSGNVLLKVAIPLILGAGGYGDVILLTRGNTDRKLQPIEAKKRPNTPRLTGLPTMSCLIRLLSHA